MRPDRDLAIVVPAYNAASTIQETLDSIQSQTALDEIASVYVVDDCSRDDTIEVARSCWQSHVPLVVSRNQKNSGQWPTVNGMVDALPANIKWYFILHADDIAKPNWVEVIAKEIRGAGERVLSYTASYDVLFPDGRLAHGEDFGIEKKEAIEGTAETIRSTLNQGCWFKISSCAIRVDGHKELQGFRPHIDYYGDWDFVLRAFRAGWTIEYIPLCLSIYRQLATSVAARSFREHRDITESIEILEEFRSYLPRAEMARLHGKRLTVLARRSLQSIATGNFSRLASAVAVSGKVSRSMIRHAATGPGDIANAPLA
jgi:glycosyltransferase involved in cell wall biosynthesis